MATPRSESDTHLGFGRGSVVREYWLMRCEGFSALRADGRRLGEVKRVETHMEGTFLRLSGLRTRTIPLSAVDTVWPGASVLVISNDQADERSEDRAGAQRAATRLDWTDDTVPWWELVDGEAAGTSAHVNSTSPRILRGSGRLTLNAPRIRTLAASLARMEPFAKAFAAWAGNVVGRSRSGARTLVRKAIRLAHATFQALDTARMSTQSAVLSWSRRIRLRVARSLIRIATWVGGSNEFAVDAWRDSRLQVDEFDTEEIDPGSGSA